MKAAIRRKIQRAVHERQMDSAYLEKHSRANLRAIKTRTRDHLLIGYIGAGLGALEIAKLLDVPVNYAFERLRQMYRLHMDELWELVKQPIKFPAPNRRRREDREIPKAA